MESNCKTEETSKNENEEQNTETKDARRKSLSHQYSKDELLDLCASPAASVRPSCLSQDFDGPDGRWDPERWHVHLSGRRSRGSSPTLMLERRPSDLERELFRRRPSDAKERIKEERDGIVLSPQRRSFGHGCQVSAQSAFTRRSGSPLEQKEGDSTSSNQTQRRIGSGRLTNRTRSLDYDDRAATRQVRERYDRDYDHEKDGRFDRYGPKDTRRLTRTEARRHYNREPEPEWFSAGPSSQSETIELHGFQTEDLRKDGGPDYTPNKVMISIKNRNGSYETHHSSSPETSRDHDTSSAAAEDQNFDINQFFSFNDTIPGLPEIVDTPEVGEASQTSRFSQWFSSGGNRSRSSSHSGGSRRSTPHEELESLHDFSNRSNPIPSPTPEAPVFLPIAPPEGQEAFLHMLQKANIDPYANAAHSEEDHPQFKDQLIAGKAKSVAELEAELKELVIGNNNKNRKPVQPVVVTHIQHPTPPPTLQKTDRQPEHRDTAPHMSAFDKLVFTMKATGNLPTVSKTVLKSDGRPLSPLELSAQNKILAAKRNGPEPAVLVRPPSGPTPPTQDTGVTLQRPEPKMPLQKLSPPPLQIPMPQMGRLTPTYAAQKELLQEIVRNNQLTAGRPLSPHFLAVNQLKPTPQQQQQMLKNMAQRSISPSQELLGALLKQQQQAAGVQRPQSPQEFLQQVLMQPQSTPRGPSPSPLSIPVSGGRATSPLPIGPIPVPPLSPLAPQPPPNTPQSGGSVIPRVPSPQELVAHTQSIYQQALIKKQLEVQKEKYLAREAARAKSPLPANFNLNQGQMRDMQFNENLLATPPSKSAPSIVPAAFTPTSVIRKMHETKAEQQQQLQQQQNTHDREILQQQQQQQGAFNTATLSPQQLFPPQQQQMGKPLDTPMNRVMMSPQRLPIKSDAPVVNPASPKHQMYQSSPIPVPMHQPPPHSPARMPHSPVRQPRKDSANMSGGDIDYNKIREVQLQQQQKAAAVETQASPGVLPSGPVPMQTRPMGQPSLPVPLLQRMPSQPGQGPPGPPPSSPGIHPALLRGMYPNLNPNVRNMSPMQLPQQGSGPRGLQQVGNVPMMLNSRAPFPVTSAGQIPANAAAAAAAAMAAMQAGMQRNLSQQQTQNVPRPELPNTPPLAGTSGNYNQTFNTTSLTQRSQSPVNLAKWFGTDVLQQPLPQMPPMMRPGPNVLSVEDIECHQ